MTTAPIIDPTSERTLTTSQLAKKVGVSAPSVWRWMTQGSEGVLLPHVKLGKAYHTTLEAARWYFREVQERKRRRLLGEADADRCDRDIDDTIAAGDDVADDLEAQLAEEGL